MVDDRPGSVQASIHDGANPSHRSENGEADYSPDQWEIIARMLMDRTTDCRLVNISRPAREEERDDRRRCRRGDPQRGDSVTDGPRCIERSEAEYRRVHEWEAPTRPSNPLNHGFGGA